MTRVLTPLDLQYVDGKTWLFIAPFAVDSDEAGRIVVDAGESTDFNSTPRIVWNILPPEEYGEAGALHDHLYRLGMLRGQPIDRGVADRVHREFLRFRKAPAWKVNAMYWGLRAFGWKVWNAYRAADVATKKAGV
jgi:hypothetical protein